MRQTIRATMLMAAAVLAGFAAAVHAGVNVPHLREDMVEIGVRPSLLGAVMLGLYFGALAMVGFALLILFEAVRAMRGLAPSRSLLAVIALVYLAFGLGALFAWGGSAHALGYALAGALAGAAAAVPSSPG